MWKAIFLPYHQALDSVIWITRVWNPLFEFPYTLQILQKKVRYYVTWGYEEPAFPAGFFVPGGECGRQKPPNSAHVTLSPNPFPRGRGWRQKPPCGPAGPVASLRKAADIGGVKYNFLITSELCKLPWGKKPRAKCTTFTSSITYILRLLCHFIRSSLKSPPF